MRFQNEPFRVVTAQPVADHENESDLAWGDLDQDGDIDVVVARKQPFITFGKRTNLLLCNEGGELVDRTTRFASAADVAGDRGFLTPTNDRDVALGDFDGDGWLDAVTAVDVSPGDPKHLSHPRIYHNQGADAQGAWLGLRFENDRFPALRHAGTGASLEPRFMSVCVGDVDGDGDLDLYFGDHDVYPDTEWGQYEDPQLDGDDRLLANDGGGRFEDVSERVSAKMRASRFCNSVQFVDLNRDGRLDLLRQSGHSTPTSVAYNDPENPGHFGLPQELYSGSPYFASAGDLNNDGRPDLVISENELDVVLYNQSTQEDATVAWSQPTPFRFVFGEDDRFAGNNLIADLDGDGWNDVIITDVDPEIASYSQRTHIYHNRGGDKGRPALLVEEREREDGGWVGVVGMTEADLRGTHDAAVFDVDGDGRNDLLLSRLAGTELWRQVDLDESPGQVPQFRAVPGAIPGPNQWTEGMAFGDVDQDGDLDVFLARGEGWGEPGRKHQNALLINQLEDQAFRFADESVERLGYSESHARDVVTADVTGDGWVDALFCNGFNTAPPYLFINRGRQRPGYFRMESDMRGLTETLASSSAAFGDVDNDGDLDLVISDAGPSFIGPPGGRPRLYENDGAGFFRESDRLGGSLKVGPMGVHLVDIDGDFDLDFFGPNRSGRTGYGHYLMLNDGSGHYHDVSHLVPETTGSVYEADNADLDGDGDIDLLFTSLSRVETEEETRFPLGEGPMRNLLRERGTLGFEKGVAIGIDDDNDVAFFDYDQDGDLDAFIASLGPKEKVLRNDGDLQFQFAEGVVEPIADPSLDIGVADLDNDRAPDLVTAQGLERIGAEQPPCQVFRNYGPKDRTPPRVMAVEKLADPSRNVGPWVVRAQVQDDVVADGEMYLTAEAWYVLNPEPRRLEVEVTDPEQGLAPIEVAVGTSITFHNKTADPMPLRGAIGAVEVRRELAAGESVMLTFVRPGKHSLRFGRRARVTVAVSGEPWPGRALCAGAGLWRFQFDGHGAAGELCYELRFVDRAGNEVRTLAEAVTLSEDAGRPRRRPR